MGKRGQLSPLTLGFEKPSGPALAACGAAPVALGSLGGGCLLAGFHTSFLEPGSSRSSPLGGSITQAFRVLAAAQLGKLVEGVGASLDSAGPASAVDSTRSAPMGTRRCPAPPL